jgi:FMN phosphatase YigB (HAD superfamily)
VPVRAVVLDLFDTLVDLPWEGLPRVELEGRARPSTLGALHAALGAPPPVPLQALARALADVDRAFREDEGTHGRELPTLERFARLAGRLGLRDPALPERLTEVHMGLLAGLARVPAHHAAVLAALRRRVRLAVCSNFSHAPTARAILARAGLAGALDAVVISHEVGLRKPRREPFEATLAALDVRPEEALHVGDDLAADVRGAAALGMRTVWLTRRVRDPVAARALVPDASPDWILRDLGEIGGLLENLD